jgi:hypothetical protein
LPNQLPRMRDAYECLRYSMGRFEEFPTRHKDARYKSPSVRRSSPIFKRIMEVLTMHLYKASPTRKLVDPETSEFLERCYKRNNLWAKQRRCDQLTCIGGFAGYQFAGSTDPTAPVDVKLWGGDQIAYWVDPDDPTKADSVAVLDLFDNQRRLRLFTREQVVTYTTDKGIIHPGFGGTAFRRQSRKPNPYIDRNGEGIIPFAFSHWTFPAMEFETNSPGLNLKELNQGVNERLDNLGDSIYFNARPIGVAEGVDDAWVPPAEIRPGDFLSLPASGVDAGGNGPLPTLRYLMADLNYISKDWEDQNYFLDHILEMNGIPPSLIRMIQTGALSGAAIQAEQLPIIGWVEGRRSDWAAYEEDDAHVCLAVAEAHLRNHGMTAEADQLQRVLDSWAFTLRWPSLFVQLPGRDRDMADEWRLKKRLVSLVGLCQERQDLTEQEAFEYLQKVKEQNDALKALGIEAEAPPAFGGFGQPEQPGGDQEQDPAADSEPREGSVNDDVDE